MQVWTLNRKWCWEEEEEEGRWDVHVVNSQPSASPPTPTPLRTHSLALSLSLTVHALTHRWTHTCSSGSHHHTLSLFSFSAAFSIRLTLSLLRLIKGQRDQRGTTLLIEAHTRRFSSCGCLDRSQDVPLTEKGLPVHLSLENQSGAKTDTVERRRRLSARRHFVGFCSTSLMGDKLAGEA